jgi:hypothetical protein
LEVYDPDHAYNRQLTDPNYIPDMNDTIVPLATLPNDNIAPNGSGAQIHDFGGQLLEFFPMEFTAGEIQKHRFFQITAPQPGNNFLAVAFPHAQWIDGIHFDPDGVTLLKEDGNEVPGLNHTGVLTVWRSLHLELDAMAAADPDVDGPFDGQPGADDDPAPMGDLPMPTYILLDPKFTPAFVDVKVDLGSYNVRPLLTFEHYFGDNDANAAALAALAGNSRRDVPSENAFWSIQLVTAYEYASNFDGDPNAEAGTLGLNVQIRLDGPTYIFYEELRDFVANDPGCGNPPQPMDFQQQIDRTSLHETVHRFGMYHGDPGGIGDEGPLNRQVNDCGTDAEHDLTVRQIARVQTVDRPR